MVANTDLRINANSIPDSSSFFKLDDDNKIVLIRSQQDYAKHWQLFQQTSERVPFLVYGRISNYEKVEKILRLGPQPNENKEQNFDQRVHIGIPTSDAASSAKDGGAATESSPGIGQNFEDIIMIDTARFIKTFAEY